MATPIKKVRKKTRYQGVYQLDEGRWLVRAVTRDPRTKRQVAREKVLTLATVEEAVVTRDALVRALEVELDPPPTPLRTTVADYAERWIALKAARVRPSVLDHYMDVLGKRVLPLLGERDVTSLVRRDVEGWVVWAEAQTSSREQAYARDTLHGWWRVLCNFLRDAAADFDIPDPVRRIRPPSSAVRNVSEHRALSGVQLQALLSTVESTFPKWYAEVHLLAHTGMRPSELYGLQWDDVDFVEGVIAIRRSVDALREVENAPKTGSPREVALTPRMRVVLERHRREQLRERGTRGSSLLFPNTQGGYRGAPALLNLLRLASRAAGLPITVGPKTLRKTFITLTALSGTDRLAIRANVGHCDEAMTERYAWVSTAEKRKVVEALEGLTGVSPGAAPV